MNKTTLLYKEKPDVFGCLKSTFFFYFFIPQALDFETFFLPFQLSLVKKSYIVLFSSPIKFYGYYYDY